MKSIFTREYELLLSCLIEARKNAGLTQHELAGMLGKIQTFVSKYERGERRLDVIEFIQIAHVLSLTASDIVAKIEQDMISTETQE